MNPQCDNIARKPSAVAVARRKRVEREWRKVVREIGSDLARISSDCDNGDSSQCAKWHGRIISVFGIDSNLPSLDDLDTEAVFGGELGHRLDFVDETADANEINLQKTIYARRIQPISLT